MKKKDSSEPKNKTMDYKEALQRAAALCSRQEQCSGHIRDKLEEWHVSEHNAERIVKKLQEEKFLDDRRYAFLFVRDKFRLNGWGRIKISYMLRRKGIDSEIIGKALDQIDEEAYYQYCADLIKTKSDTLKEKNQFTRKAKLFKFASGRGFESDLIHQILNLGDRK